MQEPDPLRDDQIADVAFYIQNPKGMTLHDPGTGKTPPTCVNQWRRWEDDKMKTVWVGPLSLLKKNARELVRFTPYEPSDVQVVHGTDDKVQAQLKSDAKTFLMGPTRFKLLHQRGLIPDRVRAIDVDEFHMCYGGAESERTLAWLDYNDRKVEQNVFMTGTLINGRLDSAYPAIRAIEPRYYPSGFDGFMKMHAVLDIFTGKRTSWRGHDKIRYILGRHAIRRTFESVFGKQEIVWQLEYVDLHDEQRAMIKEMEETAVIELEQVMLEGKNPGVALIRCRQIMEHPNAINDPRDPDHKLGLPPIDALPGKRPPKEDRLAIHMTDARENGKPLIVFSAFKKQHEDIAALAERHGFRAAYINSDVSFNQRDRIDVAYQNGELDFISASPPTAAIGYNWQFCGPVETNHIIFNSYTYLDSDIRQGVRRAIRGKRGGPLRVTGLEYYDSLDQKCRGILRQKSVEAHTVDPSVDILEWR